MAGGLAVPVASQAQPSAKVYRVGSLSGSAADALPLSSFREALRDRGYIQGKNIAFEYRFADDRNERLPGLATELVRSNLDLIVTHPTPATRVAKEATSTLPIAMVSRLELGILPSSLLQRADQVIE